MEKDYVNAMFESLQSKSTRIDCSELVGLAIKVSVSTFATFKMLLYYINSRCCLTFNN